MSTPNFFKKFLQRKNAGKISTADHLGHSDPRLVMGGLLHIVEQTDEVELSCDEVFALLDQYVEMEQQGEDVSRLLPLVERHLERCRDCREEYEALKRVIQAAGSDN